MLPPRSTLPRAILDHVALLLLLLPSPCPPSMAVRKPTKKKPCGHHPRNTDVDGCFEITLARSLAGKSKKRLRIQKAISQHGGQLSQLHAYKRVELAAALQWEFRRRASWVKHDDRSLQTLQH